MIELDRAYMDLRRHANKNEEDPNTRVHWSDCQALGWHCQALGWHFKAAVFRGLTDAASYEAMAVNVIVSSVSIILHK